MRLKKHAKYGSLVGWRCFRLWPVDLNVKIVIAWDGCLEHPVGDCLPVDDRQSVNPRQDGGLTVKLFHKQGPPASLQSSCVGFLSSKLRLEFIPVRK